jgi:hypothetical protein
MIICYKSENIWKENPSFMKKIQACTGILLDVGNNSRLCHLERKKKEKEKR